MTQLRKTKMMDDKLKQSEKNDYVKRQDYKIKRKTRSHLSQVILEVQIFILSSWRPVCAFPFGVLWLCWCIPTLCSWLCSLISTTAVTSSSFVSSWLSTVSQNLGSCETEAKIIRKRQFLLYLMIMTCNTSGFLTGRKVKAVKFSKV